jgi:flagellar protein FlaG
MKDIVSSVTAGIAKPAYQQGSQSAVKVQQEPQPGLGPVNNSVVQQAEQEQTTAQDPQAVEKAVEDINDHLQTIGRDLSFSVDNDSGRTIIKVMDSETDEVIRQIPSEEVLNLAQYLQDVSDLNSTGLEEKV